MAERFDLSVTDYAHRGLWSDGGLPENSLGAFLAADAAGFGIEFDVRPDATGRPVIFHDPVLDRMTSESGLVAERTTAELEQIALARTADTIPSLDRLLAHWPNRFPLLCEMKIDGDTDAAVFAQHVGQRLLEVEGPVAAMSFNPAAVRALPAGLMRGQLLAPVAMTGDARFGGLLERERRAEVDYLACHVSDAALVSEQLGEACPPLVAWTVTDASDGKRLRAYVDGLIFESFLP